MNKRLCVVLVVFFCFCFPLTPSFACWGSRPLAMGGAFVGVADSIDAVYWNPAGLATMPKKQGNFNCTFTNWRDYNYDIYAAIGGSGENSGLGFSYVYNKNYLTDIFFEDGRRLGWFTQDWHYFQTGYGMYLVKKWNLAVGITGKIIHSFFEIDVKNEDLYGKDAEIANSTLFDSDLGLIWSFGPGLKDDRKGSRPKKMFTLGCLVQDILKSKLKFDIEGEELEQGFITNVRPGFSFRPDKATIISLEVYDARAEIFDKPQLRVGVERCFKFTKNGEKHFSIRAGGYHINADEEDRIKAYTFGLQWGAFAYTVMNWVDTNDKTHFFAVELSFY